MRNTSKRIRFCAGLLILTPRNGAPAPQQDHVQANGITIAYQSFGPPDRETILLIAGTGMQLTGWPVQLCEELVKRNYRVVIYDNRDTGQARMSAAISQPGLCRVAPPMSYSASSARPRGFRRRRARTSLP